MAFSALFIILLLVALPVSLAFTLIVYFIYKFFYNKHLNKAIQSETKLRKWLSPFVVVLITIGCCVVCVLGMTYMVYMFKYNVNSGSSTMNQAMLQINEKNGEYEVKSNTGFLMQKQFDLDGVSITSYNNENELFAVFDIKDSEKVDYFIVYEGEESKKVEYKDLDDKFLNPFEMYIDIQYENEPIKIEVYSEDVAEPIGEAVFH